MPTVTYVYETVEGARGDASELMHTEYRTWCTSFKEAKKWLRAQIAIQEKAAKERRIGIEKELSDLRALRAKIAHKDKPDV